MRKIEVVWVPIDTLTPDPKNARTHSKRQINQLASSMRAFDFNVPILIDNKKQIVAGHGRWLAAKKNGLTGVPTIQLAHLNDKQLRAYALADNRIAENAGWDNELLALELGALADLEIDLSLTGFEMAEIDILLSDVEAAAPVTPTGPHDATPSPATEAVTRAGDVWRLGQHRLLCGDARDSASIAALVAGALVFTDPPYNVPIAGHVRTHKGHRDFAMAVGELSSTAFRGFLCEGLRPAVDACRDGSIVFVCMDWRHLSEAYGAAQDLRLSSLNLCVWAKTNGGMGSLYRSQHELVLVLKKGQAPHCNNVELGAHGRYRTNVWRYAGVNAFKAERDDELAMHPTVKPVALVEDAIKDVTKRNELVLDPFGGSGTTLIAAERCGRRGLLVELNPIYCDVIVQRFQKYTGKTAVLERSGKSFEDVSIERGAL